MPSDSQTTAMPNPGSDTAVALGCICPVSDNSRGAGWMGSGQFWIEPGCPLHAPKKEVPDHAE